MLNTKLGILRDRVPETLIYAFQCMNRKDRIEKAFELCQSGEYNPSCTSLTSRKLCQLLDNLHWENPNLANAITAPQKQPHDSNTHGSNSTILKGYLTILGTVTFHSPVHLRPQMEFTNSAEDRPDVTVDEVFNYMAGNWVPDGLEVVNSSLHALPTCAEEAEPDTLDEASPSSSLQSRDLGWGMQARQACNLDEEMKIFHF
ncbi:uncharacterized protein EI90DRAFT_3124554 [Cantharellus anzutake]|uniref:uncharacterized protein n=1 Tax=Cantharellus anzutake TaxID=1750568 RepID=UPI00190851AD|nr:uncharacterized protein EI90DRAFT_3124554 [Cantharellus anzutake]KAF8330139.1 hypothetical protein EI90DRAFT_3124554 [Cantharellus anzutake]